MEWPLTCAAIHKASYLKHFVWAIYNWLRNIRFVDIVATEYVQRFSGTLELSKRVIWPLLIDINQWVEQNLCFDRLGSGFTTLPRRKETRYLFRNSSNRKQKPGWSGWGFACLLWLPASLLRIPFCLDGSAQELRKPIFWDVPRYNLNENPLWQITQNHLSRIIPERIQGHITSIATCLYSSWPLKQPTMCDSR